MNKWMRRGLKTAGIAAILAAIADLYQWREETERALDSMDQDFGTHYHEGRSILFGQSNGVLDTTAPCDPDDMFIYQVRDELVNEHGYRAEWCAEQPNKKLRESLRMQRMQRAAIKRTGEPK